MSECPSLTNTHARVVTARLTPATTAVRDSSHLHGTVAGGCPLHRWHHRHPQNVGHQEDAGHHCHCRNFLSLPPPFFSVRPDIGMRICYASLTARTIPCIPPCAPHCCCPPISPAPACPPARPLIDAFDFRRRYRNFIQRMILWLTISSFFSALTYVLTRDEETPTDACVFQVGITAILSIALTVVVLRQHMSLNAPLKGHLKGALLTGYVVGHLFCLIRHPPNPPG